MNQVIKVNHLIHETFHANILIMKTIY